MPSIEKSNWRVHWRMSESAGVVLYLVDYKGSRMLWEGSLPYVTIDHQRQDLSVDDAGTEAHGPFWMPLGARTMTGPVRHNDFRGGFELACDFQCGPFRYTQLWRFHDDGRLAPLLTIYGSGIHDGHTYHPHWRFDFDLDGALDDAVEYFDGKRWVRVDEEGWFPHAGEAAEDGSVWRQIDFGSGVQVSIRPHSWEDGELFAIRYHDGEWPPFSPRGSTGGQTFPAAYVGSEALDGEDIALWYVAHVHYDGAFPFTAGPWLKRGTGPSA